MFNFKDYTVEELKNLRFFVPMRPFDIKLPLFGFGIKSSDSKEIPILCKFIEKNYRLEDHYKCEVVPADENLQPYFSKETYYQCDFESMINRDDYIVMKTSDKQHVEEITWREYLTPTVYIEHSGFTIVD